jgi:hypothetical protein
VDGGMVSENRTEWNDSRAARQQQQWPAQRFLPNEVAANRAAQLELVAGTEHVDQVGGNLSLLEPLYREAEMLVLRRRGDGVTALRLITILGGEPDVDVLAGEVTRPPGAAEDQAPHPRRFIEDLDYLGELPVQSPEYRCSRHGSP